MSVLAKLTISQQFLLTFLGSSCRPCLTVVKTDHKFTTVLRCLWCKLPSNLSTKQPTLYEAKNLIIFKSVWTQISLQIFILKRALSVYLLRILTDFCLTIQFSLNTYVTMKFDITNQWMILSEMTYLLPLCTDILKLESTDCSVRCMNYSNCIVLANWHDCIKNLHYKSCW
jgi:hypothetical protein